MLDCTKTDISHDRCKVNKTWHKLHTVFAIQHGWFTAYYTIIFFNWKRKTIAATLQNQMITFETKSWSQGKQFQTEATGG